MNVLTENAIKALASCDPKHLPFNQCTLQVLNFKLMPNSPRYRAILSDGIHLMQALIATDYSSMVQHGDLVKNCIIRIYEYNVTITQNKRIPILFGFEVLSGYPLEKIGNPMNVDFRTSSDPLAGAQLSLQSSSFQQNQQQHQPLPAPIQHVLVPSQQNRAINQQHQFPMHQRIPRPFQQQTSLTPQHQQQQPLFMENHGTSYFSQLPIHQREDFSLVAINRLNPYQNRWTIKARVVQKSDIKTWSNARSEGKLFSVHLLDNTGEIKATVFQGEVDRFYPILEEGQMYYITNGRVVAAKKQFSTLSNEYELTLEHATEVEMCTDDQSIPKMACSFTKIADIDQKQKDDIVDVLGVVYKDSGLSEVISKMNGAPIKKRELCIVDDTQKEIRVTLWGRTAELFDSADFPVVVFKGLKVNDFGGYNLSLQNSGDIKRNPNIPEAHQLQSWYRTLGQQATYSTFTITATSNDNNLKIKSAPKMTIADAKGKHQRGEHESANVFTVRGTVIYIKTDSYCYASCPECHKKLIVEGNSWRCEKCLLVHSAPDYRYLLSFSIQDDTSHMYVMAFHEAAEQLLEKTVSELHETYGVDPRKMVAFDPPIFRTYNFTIKAQHSMYNDLARTKYILLEPTSVDFIKEGYDLVAAIDAMMA